MVSIHRTNELFEGEPEYIKIKSDTDSLSPSQKNLAQAQFKATNRLQNKVQGRNMTFQEYMDRYQKLWKLSWLMLP